MEFSNGLSRTRRDDDDVENVASTATSSTAISSTGSFPMAGRLGVISRFSKVGLVLLLLILSKFVHLHWQVTDHSFEPEFRRFSANLELKDVNFMPELQSLKREVGNVIDNIPVKGVQSKEEIDKGTNWGKSDPALDYRPPFNDTTLTPHNAGIYYCTKASRAFREAGFSWARTQRAASKRADKRSIQESLNLCDDSSKLELLTNPRVDSYTVFAQKVCDVLVNESIPLYSMHLNMQHNPMNCCRNAYPAYISLVYALENMNIPGGANGLWLEFGVNQGYSINLTSIIKGTRALQGNIHGFDSFFGLPRPFELKGYRGFKNQSYRFLSKNHFDQNGNLPLVRKDITLHKGLFNETLPTFFNGFADAKISWLNVDNDLYEGAVYILDYSIPRFMFGSIIHFHELVTSRESTDQCVENEEIQALYDVMRKDAHRDFKLQLLQFSNALFFQPAVFRVVS